jgi:tRNA (cmo5U34)-methyltransferase
MATEVPGAEWQDAERVSAYRDRADEFPHRLEGESVLIEHLADDVERVLDLGCGDGRLLAKVLDRRPGASGVGVDFSEAMLSAARERFDGEERVELVEHDLNRPLPELGEFDAVVSSMAIHHLEDDRKRELYGECLQLLAPGGAFLNFEHVASPTERLHAAFFAAISEARENEDPSDRTVLVETQLGWLREIGFEDVDCHWKWLEMALLAGVRPDR